MRAAAFFEQGIISAEIARRVGVSHQVVSDWRTVWQRYGQDGLRGAHRDLPPGIVLGVELSK